LNYFNRFLLTDAVGNKTEIVVGDVKIDDWAAKTLSLTSVFFSDVFKRHNFQYICIFASLKFETTKSGSTIGESTLQYICLDIQTITCRKKSTRKFKKKQSVLIILISTVYIYIERERPPFLSAAKCHDACFKAVKR
jgi:hypothetical protein